MRGPKKQQSEYIAHENDFSIYTATSRSDFPINSSGKSRDIAYLEIEKVYEELQEEKKRISLQASRLKKFQYILGNKEMQLEQEKLALHMKRDRKKYYV